MLKLADVATLKKRAERIGLSLRELARASGVAPTTVYRALNGHDITVRKLSRLNREMDRREAELRQSLVEADQHVEC